MPPVTSKPAMPPLGARPRSPAAPLGRAGCLALGPNTIEENARWLVIRVLRYELTTERLG